MNECRAQIINIAGQRIILGSSIHYKTHAAHYRAIKQEIAEARRVRRGIRRFKKESQQELSA